MYQNTIHKINTIIGGGAPLEMAKNISPIITKLSGPVDIGLIRMYTKFEGEKMIRN